MNRNEKLIITNFLPMIRWRVILVILGIGLTFSACEKECYFPEDEPINNQPVEVYPSLKLVNELKESWRPIVEVSLVGYEFNSLNIEPNGGSQTFTLDKGMPAGYENINVKVRYKQASTYIATRSIIINLKKGNTTKITLKGGSSEGQSGIYLESSP